jgi:hypothetical protein
MASFPEEAEINFHKFMKNKDDYAFLLSICD